jgi:methanogenic corrinoid protein MtbC1
MGRYEAYTSLYVLDELEETKDEHKRLNMIALINEYDITVIPGDDEAQRLAAVYVDAGIIPAAKIYDSLHIAIATISDLDYIFSFNFHHINRVKTKTMTSAINLTEGYKPVTIATPGEVIEYGSNE